MLFECTEGKWDRSRIVMPSQMTFVCMTRTAASGSQDGRGGVRESQTEHATTVSDPEFKLALSVTENPEFPSSHLNPISGIHLRCWDEALWLVCFALLHSPSLSLLMLLADSRVTVCYVTTHTRTHIQWEFSAVPLFGVWVWCCYGDVD